jgi:hypothetical protein
MEGDRRMSNEGRRAWAGAPSWSSSTTTSEATETETETSASGSFASGDCLKLSDATSKLGEAAGATGKGAESLEKSAELYQQLVAEIPEAIRPDVQVVANAYSKYVDAVKDLDLESGKTPSVQDLTKIQQALAAIVTPEVIASSQHIATWTQQKLH